MEGVGEELYDIFDKIDVIWEYNGLSEPTITSGMDRTFKDGHKKYSRHHWGGAIDIRANDIKDNKLQDEVAHDLQ